MYLGFFCYLLNKLIISLDQDNPNNCSVAAIREQLRQLLSVTHPSVLLDCSPSQASEFKVSGGDILFRPNLELLRKCSYSPSFSIRPFPFLLWWFCPSWHGKKRSLLLQKRWGQLNFLRCWLLQQGSKLAF